MTNDSLILDPSYKRPLRILFVEDNSADVELCMHELEKAKMEVLTEIVETRVEFVGKLQRASYDIVLADYQLVGWTGMDALKVMRDRGDDAPFILVTGALGDAVVVDCVKQGVSDYILKDRISRLPTAICKVLQERYLIEERKLALFQLRESEEKFRTLTETIASAIFVYGAGKCRYANRAAEVITGYSRNELLELGSQDLIHPDSRDLGIQMVLGPVSGNAAARRYELKIITKSGEARWLDMTSSLVAVKGEPSELVTAFDITERKGAEEEIRHLVASDPLTGLANYRRLLDAFDSERERSGRTGRPFALLFLDVDGLKNINDVYGHLVGSRALCRVGSVLRTQCRTLDIPGRYGGDEFAVILPETGAAAARHLADRIAAKVQGDGEQPYISVSFGLAVCPDDGDTFKEVLRIADAGLYLMKGQPRTEDRRFSVKHSRPGCDPGIQITNKTEHPRKSKRAGG